MPSSPGRTRALRLARHAVLSAAVVAVTAAACTPQTSNGYSRSGSDSRARPAQLFAPTSFWYQKLPADAPVAAESGAVLRRLHKEAPRPNYPAATTHGLPQMAINTTVYTPPIYIARNSDPTVTFSWNNCQGKRDDQGLIRSNLTSLHMPSDALPAQGSDGEMVVYNVDTRQYTDTWITRRQDGRWSACWGGTIRDARSNPGIFPHPFGATASGLPLEPGTLKASELAAGRIDHVVGVVLPRDAVAKTPSGPAVRTDGQGDGPDTIAMGQMMRLPADLNLDRLKLNKPTRTLAEAAKTYGLIVWDTGDGITFRAENTQALQNDPYPGIFGDVHPALALWGDPKKGEDPFPVDKLQVLRRGYLTGGVPVAPTQ